METHETKRRMPARRLCLDYSSTVRSSAVTGTTRPTAALPYPLRWLPL